MTITREEMTLINEWSEKFNIIPIYGRISLESTISY